MDPPVDSRSRVAAFADGPGKRSSEQAGDRVGQERDLTLPGASIVGAGVAALAARPGSGDLHLRDLGGVDGVGRGCGVHDADLEQLVHPVAWAAEHRGGELA